jgi:leukotriene-C4 synthase
VNCSEYFPLFLSSLWVAGIFFHEGLGAGLGRKHWASLGASSSLLTPPCPTPAGASALCGLVYLFARLRYFQGYARSEQLR